MHLVEHPFGARGMAHLAVECLGEAGWAWRVWDASHRLWPQHGSAGTLTEAKARTERALLGITERPPRPA